MYSYGQREKNGFLGIEHTMVYSMRIQDLSNRDSKFRTGNRL